MPEEMHALAKHKQHYQKTVSGRQMDVIPSGLQQPRDRGEGDQHPAGAETQEVAGSTRAIDSRDQIHPLFFALLRGTPAAAPCVRSSGKCPYEA
jgi:hypothetical protein